MIQLVIASSNLHKIREYKQILDNFPKLPLEILSLKDFQAMKAPLEDQDSFEGNSSLKAEFYFHQLQAQGLHDFWVLADDSGLVVPALKDKSPSIHSARYAGQNATDKENCEKLMKEMQNLQGDERSAYFTCAITVKGEDFLISREGRCEGKIIEHERGGQGFGYDSLFLKEESHLTFGQMSETVKNKVSHRRKALEKTLLYLESKITENSSQD